MDEGIKSKSSSEADPDRMTDEDEQYVGLCRNIRVLIPQIGLAIACNGGLLPKRDGLAALSKALGKKSNVSCAPANRQKA